MIRLLSLILIVGGLAAPLFAGAQGFPYWGPILSCTADYLDPAAAHCRSVCDIFETASNATSYATTLLVFLIAPLMFVVGGGMMLVSAGSPEMVGRGRKILTGTAVGVLLVMGSWVIVATILWLVGNPASGTRVSWPQIECNPANVPGRPLETGGFNPSRSAPAPSPSGGTPCGTATCTSTEICRAGRCVPASTGTCNPANPNSCPAGQRCLNNIATGNFTCQ